MCLSPYRKYVLITVFVPIFIVGTLILLHQFESLKAFSSLLFFLAFMVGLFAIVYSTYIKCPECGQSLGCNEKGYCFQPFDMSQINAIAWHHCKKCSYDLSRCEEE